MKKKLISAAMAVLSSGFVFAMGANRDLGIDKPGMTPGGIQRKFIGLFFDVMNTSPSNILANADQFVEQTPYLDGVAISLKDIPAFDLNGNVITSDITHIMRKTERWTRDALRSNIPVLKKIAEKPRLTESFLLFWMTPRTKEDRLAWTDDAAWANFAENMAVAAWLAKEGGMKGLMLDPEEYAGAYQYIHTPEDPSFEESARLARQRGREVFSRVFKEYPDIVIFTLWYFAKFRPWMEEGLQTHPTVAADDSGELLQYFYNGILDVLPPEARIVDGCEHYSHSATRHQYKNHAIIQSTGALPFVAPENMVKYRSQVHYSSAHYLDMYRTNANPKSIWYHGPVNGSRLEHLRLNMAQSIYTSTEYVWVYGEGGGKLFNWRDGNYANRATWEEMIPGMTETIMVEKDPERWARMRSAALEAEGKLTNLVSVVKRVKIENPIELRSYSEPAKDMPSVKNVKPGERYLISVMCQTSKRNSKGRREAACPRVVWRKNGRPVDAAAVNIPVPEEATVKLTETETVVTVPDGVDELVLDLAAKLNADERAHYRHPSIRNALDPVAAEKARPASKWTLDLKKRTLTNGHWTLSAWERKGYLTVTGNGKNTLGGGVLDLTKVKADTGYAIGSIGNFAGFAGITGLVAPDVASVSTRAFSGCENMKVVVIGDLPVSKRAVTANDRRIEHLNQMGLGKELANIAKRVGYWHMPFSQKIFGSEFGFKGVKPGELYNIGVSMKRYGAGDISISARFCGGGKTIWPKKKIGMTEPRKDGVWRSGQALVRAPEGADELCFEIYTRQEEGPGSFEFKDFFINKLSDGLPVWPAEALKEKQR